MESDRYSLEVTGDGHRLVRLLEELHLLLGQLHVQRTCDQEDHLLV